MVSHLYKWSSFNNIVLGQIKVDEKSNEITAIPTLIERLEIEVEVISQPLKTTLFNKSKI